MGIQISLPHIFQAPVPSADALRRAPAGRVWRRRPLVAIDLWVAGGIPRFHECLQILHKSDSRQISDIHSLDLEKCAN